jgi:hypothetical protein
LQERDLAIFRWVSEQKFATKDQIQKQFFPNHKLDSSKPDRVCVRRLLELVKFGFLEKRHVVTDRVQIYQIGKAALAELNRRGETTLPYLDRIDLKGFDHDCRVNEFRISMSWIGAKDWRSERQLHQAGYLGHVPDGLFRLGENLCAVEVEVSLKRLDRYPAIFKSYMERKDERPNAVFYLCGTAAVRDTVRRLAGDTRRFCFALWEDFLKHGVNTEFENPHMRVAPASMV